jgi:hypothetical protein
MNASLSLHPVNLAAALAAAEAFRLEVAGVDMISTDISVPWTENGAAINAVNGGPRRSEQGSGPCDPDARTGAQRDWREPDRVKRKGGHSAALCWLEVSNRLQIRSAS